MTTPEQGGMPEDTRVAQVSPHTTPHATEHATAHATAHVLIVEDERSIATVVAEVVSDAGHVPRVAHNGRQALEMAQEQWPALVITDLMLPHLDGAGLIAALRREARTQGQNEPPIILMTAASMQHARAAHADAVLRKPFSLAALDALLLRFLA